MEIPIDILLRIKSDFQSLCEYNQALSLINHVRLDNLNVGWEQLSRSLLILADGDIYKLKNIVENNYGGDPRDVIMDMMNKPNSNNDFGMTPFKNL